MVGQAREELPTKPGWAEPRTARSWCRINHPGHHAEQGTWGSRTRKHREAGFGRPEDGGVWLAKLSNDPHNNQHNPPYASYWAPLTRKRHILPHPAQPRHTNHWAPRTRKQHQREHRPQRLTESSNLTQHTDGRTGDCPGLCKETTTRRNVTRGGRPVQNMTGERTVTQPQNSHVPHGPRMNEARGSKHLPPSLYTGPTYSTRAGLRPAHRGVPATGVATGP